MKVLDTAAGATGRSTALFYSKIILCTGQDSLHSVLLQLNPKMQETTLLLSFSRGGRNFQIALGSNSLVCWKTKKLIYVMYAISKLGDVRFLHNVWGSFLNSNT